MERNKYYSLSPEIQEVMDRLMTCKNFTPNPLFRHKKSAHGEATPKGANLNEQAHYIKNKRNSQGGN